jgi:hypothetical protein
MRIWGIGIVFVLAAATTAATAAETTIGGVSIKLPPPVGFCDLSESNPADKRVVTTISGLVAQSGNTMLVMSADCQQLADWRAGKRTFLDDYGQYQTPTKGMDQLVASPETYIQATCSGLRTQGNQIVAGISQDVKTSIESALKEIKMNSLAFAGVFDESKTACYAGEIQKLQTENRMEKTQLILIGIAVVKNKVFFVDRMTVYAGPDTAKNALAKLEDSVAALYAANQ